MTLKASYDRIASPPMLQAVRATSANPALEFECLLAPFSSLSLAQVQQKTLMDRFDSKFLLSHDTLRAMLPNLKEYYAVLEVNGNRVLGYQNFYYDTADFAAYSAHHNGKLHRYKVRYRQYRDTDSSFLEVKLKTNKGKSVKNRISVMGMPLSMPAAQEEFIRALLPKGHQGFERKMEGSYRRISLVSKDAEERLTLDFALTFSHLERDVALKHTVIAELKQPIRSSASPFRQVARAHKLHATSFSKYCIGCCMVHPELKQNRFKPVLLTLKKLEDGRF